MKIIAGINYNAKLLFFWLLLSQLLITDSVWAGFEFLDPQIPNGETIKYRSKSKDKIMFMEEKVILISEGTKKFYEITSLSSSFDKHIRIDRKNMTVSSVHTIKKFDSALLDSKLVIKDASPNTSDDSIKIPHFVALTHLLRGFPFESKNKIRISYYGESDDKKFNFCIRNKKRENIKVNEIEIECYKLEFGIDGFLATFLPELELWYTVKPPHYMVKYKGLEGPPGTPERLIELIDYKVP